MCLTVKKAVIYGSTAMTSAFYKNGKMKDGGSSGTVLVLPVTYRSQPFELLVELVGLVLFPRIFVIK
jgi:hypothetical protein